MHDDDYCDALYEYLRKNVENGLAKGEEILSRVRRGKPSRETWALTARAYSDALERISYMLEKAQAPQSLRALLEMDGEDEQ